ncbi:MAG: DNA topoisomerase 3 [Desulfurella sp.]
MILYIAEKPSLAKAIADGLGFVKKEKTHIICKNNNVVTWCFGHLLELAKPDEYIGSKAWELETLPIIPQTWIKYPKQDSKAQLNAVVSLIKKANKVVNAGDPDREGQLLVDEVIEYSKYKGPVARLWLHALDKVSVQKAISQIKDNKQYLPLRQSAELRSKADWLIGMNLTRLFTKKNTGNTMISIGRVRTPTLALIYQRWKEIQNFKPKDFYMLVNKPFINNAFLDLTLITKNLKKGVDEENRLVDRKYAEAIAKATSKTNGVIESVKEEKKTEYPPMPFNLSRLQKFMNEKFSWRAKQTLECLQNLYEYKLVTYPRTDCEYLPEEQFNESKTILSNISQLNLFKKEITMCDMNIKHKAWNSSKLSAHHAIIPTQDTSNYLKTNENEKLLYSVIVKSYIMLFLKPYVYLQQTITADIAGFKWQSIAKKTIQKGFKEIFNDKAEVEYPSVKEKQRFTSSETEIQTKKTTPPNCFTDGTIIEAMSHIHRFINDEKAKAILKETDGLGTEATRAQIIEELIKLNYIKRNGKCLEPVMPLVEQILSYLPHQVKDPVLTAQWESMLSDVANGNLKTGEKFLQEQINLVRQIVEQVKTSPNLELPATCVNYSNNTPKACYTKQKNSTFWKEKNGRVGKKW